MFVMFLQLVSFDADPFTKYVELYIIYIFL